MFRFSPVATRSDSSVGEQDEEEEYSAAQTRRMYLYETPEQVRYPSSHPPSPPPVLTAQQELSWFVTYRCQRADGETRICKQCGEICVPVRLKRL